MLQQAKTFVLCKWDNDEHDYETLRWTVPIRHSTRCKV